MPTDPPTCPLCFHPITGGYYEFEELGLMCEDCGEAEMLVQRQVRESYQKHKTQKDF